MSAHMYSSSLVNYFFRNLFVYIYLDRPNITGPPGVLVIFCTY